MRISDWSSDVCSSDLRHPGHLWTGHRAAPRLTATLDRERRSGHEHQPARPAGSADPSPAVLSADPAAGVFPAGRSGCVRLRSEEHTSELQSLMRISYAVSCSKNKYQVHTTTHTNI